MSGSSCNEIFWTKGFKGQSMSGKRKRESKERYQEILSDIDDRLHCLLVIDAIRCVDGELLGLREKEKSSKHNRKEKIQTRSEVSPRRERGLQVCWTLPCLPFPWGRQFGSSESLWCCWRCHTPDLLSQIQTSPSDQVQTIFEKKEDIEEMKWNEKGMKKKKKEEKKNQEKKGRRKKKEKRREEKEKKRSWRRIARRKMMMNWLTFKFLFVLEFQIEKPMKRPKEMIKKSRTCIMRRSSMYFLSVFTISSTTLRKNSSLVITILHKGFVK